MIKSMINHGTDDRSMTSGRKYPGQCLVVDDSHATREIVTSVLQKRKINVLSASNGLDAWQRLQRERFDLVITDIEMPIWSGTDLVQAMRQARHEWIKGTSVIVTSSMTDLDTLDLVRSYGSAYFMAKPLDASELDVMLRLLETARRLED